MVFFCPIVGEAYTCISFSAWQKTTDDQTLAIISSRKRDSFIPDILPKI
jgi:hypothetical protein